MKNAGQTIVEIVVVIGVIVVLTTGLVAITTVSLRNSRVSSARTQAVKIAAEGMEFVREKRDTGWMEFQALTGTWCIGDGDVWIQLAQCEVNVGSLYRRKAVFMWNEAENRMDVTVTVSWPEGNTTQQTQLQSFFTNWQSYDIQSRVYPA